MSVLNKLSLLVLNARRNQYTKHPYHFVDNNVLYIVLATAVSSVL